ncbi:MAG: hypothetical protein ACLSTO_01165 [Bilophila wadsworthia]
MRLAAHADKGEAVRGRASETHRLADAAGLPPRVDAAGGEHRRHFPRRAGKVRAAAPPGNTTGTSGRMGRPRSGLSRLVGDPPGSGVAKPSSPPDQNWTMPGSAVHFRCLPSRPRAGLRRARPIFLVCPSPCLVKGS